MIRSILKAVFVGWIAKKFLGRSGRRTDEPAPTRRPDGRVA